MFRVTSFSLVVETTLDQKGMEMIKIEIQSTDLLTKSGVSAKTGRPYNMREQSAWAHTCDRNGKPNPYPVRLALMLNDDQSAYAPGLYTLAPESLYTDKFNQLQIFPILKPLVQQAKQAA